MKQDYTMLIFKLDKRTKTGKRLVGRYEFQGRTDQMMVREAMELRPLYPQKDYVINWRPTYTTVKSLMTGADVQIRTEDVGSVVDPSRETYWTM